MNWKNAAGLSVAKATTIVAACICNSPTKVISFTRSFTAAAQLPASALVFPEYQREDQLEHITRKLLSRLDQMEEDGVLAESLR